MIGLWFAILVIFLPLLLLAISGGNLGALIGGVVCGFVLWLVGLVGYMVFADPSPGVDYDDSLWDCPATDTYDNC